ncbi:MAG: hypothetical protein IIY21_24615 [Clostridiales bacterium]|nr:hypothetical protein [Clostridiales bacterium]MBQ1571101.1 hypothetical protein [Clostridiales bacterium]
MKYEDIQKASASIKTTDIRGKQYAEVNQRIKAFRMLCPNGCISTEILSNADGMVIMKASVLDEEGRLLGTGTAYEREGSSNINKTSYIENCETSAVGRALAMCGFGIDLSVASYEEVSNAIEQQNKKPAEKKSNGFPPRLIMLDIAKKNYPEGSEKLKTLLSGFEIKKLEDLTDYQLQAIYSKYGEN